MVETALFHKKSHGIIFLFKLYAYITAIKDSLKILMSLFQWFKFEIHYPNHILVCFTFFINYIAAVWRTESDYADKLT